MEWRPSQKIAFRFFASYFTLFCLSNQFITTYVFDPFWRLVVPWFAEHILQLTNEITVFTNGSGDTTFNYVSLLVDAILALLITAVWSYADRRRPNYDRALQWFTVLVRYYLVYQMVIYGLAKVFYLQFQPPHFAKLVQPYGDSSPMGLLWTFMGFSKGYTIFTGLGELAGGILLLFRRTVTLGALVVFAVMANVMALNFFYDVPVKILSSHIVMMSLLLIVLDSKRLWNLFIANKPVEARQIVPFFTNPQNEKVKNIAKGFIASIAILGALFYMNRMLQKWGPDANRPALYGLYEVDTFERNGEERPPLTSDYTRWRRLIIERGNRAVVQMMDNSQQYYEMKVDTTDHYMTINLPDDTSRVDTLHFSYPDSTHLLLQGLLQKDTMKIVMKVRKKENFQLMNRGFRWVSEYPYNR